MTSPTLMEEIMVIIARPLGRLVCWLEKNYNVDRSEIYTKWKDLSGIDIVTEEEEDEDDRQSISNSTTPVKLNKKIPKTKKVCQHIFLSGQKAGEQCSTKPKGGASFCSAHRPKNSVVKDTKKPKKKINCKGESEPESHFKVLSKKADTSPQIAYSSFEDLSEPENIKPLLKKRALNSEVPKSINISKEYNTDDEPLDEDLNLSDEN